MTNNQIIRKGISFLLIPTLILSGFFITPNIAQAQTVEKTVTKYHLDIGVQQIWGVFTGKYDGTGNEIVDWDDSIGKGSQMSVSTSITVDKYKAISNVKVYEYSASKFKWDDPNYTSNVGSPEYYKDNYANFASNSISVSNYSASGNTASFSYTASMSSGDEYDLALRLNKGQISEVFSLMAGPYSTNPEADVKKNFPSLYTKLNAGRDGVDPKVRAFMYFTPVIIQYDVKEMVDIPDPDPESIIADLDAPSSVKTGEGYNVLDATLVGDKTMVKSAKLYRTINGEKELIDTWLGSGAKGKHTGGSIHQIIAIITTVKYEIEVTTVTGLTDTATKIVNIEDGKSYSGNVNLVVIPTITHEGHTVRAIDDSTYTITEDKESRTVSAGYAYSEGFASNRWIVPDGKIKKDDYDAYVTFPKKGTYPITLEVRLKGSGTMSDVENVQVLKTPYVYDTLGGFQKQNRKQTLTFKIATYPGKPITSWDLSIKDLKTNEIANISEENLAFIGNTIKTREAKFEVLDDCWSQITIEFLTKYPRYSLTGELSQDFSYKLKVEDSKGDTDEVYKGFPVAPDKPPMPIINMQTMYTRVTGTNFAPIEAECNSKSDGDSLKRIWSVAKHNPINNLADGQNNILAPIPEDSFKNAKELPNYEEIGFGTDQKIGYDSEGVGISSVKLHLKDVWTEPTLPEFINPSDYLEASGISKTLTTNIAPVVSIENLDVLKANIMMLVTKEKLAETRSKENEMNVNFIENNIDANLTINEIEKGYDFSEIQQYDKLYQSENYQYARWQQDRTLIRCYDIDENIVWKYNIVKEPPSNPNPTIVDFCADQKENYSVLITDGYRPTTSPDDDVNKWAYEKDLIIINAQTGVPIVTYKNTGLETIDLMCINNANNIIYMVHGKGISKVNLKTGKITDIDKSQIYQPKILKGKLTYVKRISSLSYGINAIDLKTEELTSRVLPSFQFEKYPVIKNGPGRNLSSNLNLIMWDAHDTLLFGTYETCVTVNAKTGSQAISNTNYSYPTDTYKFSNYNYESVAFVLDELGEAIYYKVDNQYDADLVNGPPYQWLKQIFRLDDHKYVTIEENKSIEEKIKSGEYSLMYQAENKFAGKYKLLQALNKYSVLNENNTYLTFDDIEYEKDEKANKFIEINGIRVVDKEFMAETVNADLTSNKDLALRIKGDKTNLAEIYKEVKIDSGKTYNYSYNLNVKAGAPSDLLAIESSQILEENGKPYYKEIIYKEDLTRGEVQGSENVKYMNGGWFKLSEYWGIGSGYGSGRVGKNDRSVGGPRIDLYLEKEGYVDLQISQPDSTRGIHVLIDGHRSKFNDTPSSFRILKKLSAGNHTLELIDAGAWNSYSRFIATIEVGYLHEAGTKKSSSTLNKNGDGSYSVEGSFTTQSDVLFNYVGRNYIPTNSVIFGPSDVGTTSVSSGGNRSYGIISDRLNMFSCSGVGDHRDRPASITAFGNGFTVGGSMSQELDFGAENTTNEWMVVSYQWNGNKYRTLPKTYMHLNDNSIQGEYQGSLGSSSGNNRPFPDAQEVHKIWYIIPPGGTASTQLSRTTSDDGGGWWNLYNLKYCYLDAETVKTLKYPNMKLDEAKINGFFEWDQGAENDYSLLECKDQSSLNVIDMFSIPDKIIVDKYRNITQDNTDIIKFTTENTKGIDAYISDLTIKETGSKSGFNNILQDRNFNFFMSLENNNWIKKTIGSGIAGIEQIEKTKSEEDTLVYKKGQLVKYGINYSDYENDPSKAEQGYSGWIYAHTPFNDGNNPDAAIIYDEDGNIIEICGENVKDKAYTIEQAVEIARTKGGKTLAEAIDKFYIDGKYTVYHFEYDDTSRGYVIGGYPIYDKSSNMADLTFYVQGTAAAPWITGISTSPDKVKENAHFSINIGIDDVEKDVLNLTTEVYKDRKLVHTHRRKNILPLDANGNTTTNPAIAVGYPVTNTGALPNKAQSGKYEVVCTVRDQTGAGIGNYSFVVISEGKITGEVYHTEKWEENRKKYNLSLFKGEINKQIAYSEYMKLKEPRTRGTNVFWSGEKFMLQAAVASDPTKVTCQIKGTSYSTTMRSTGRKNPQDETIYEGSVWDKTMMYKWGMKAPEELTFVFTATYSGGTVKTHEAKIIVDNMDEYWRLHRVF